MIKFILSKNHLSFCHNKQIQPSRHLSPINKIISNILLIRYYKQAKRDWDIEIAYCDFLTNDKMTKSPCWIQGYTQAIPTLSPHPLSFRSAPTPLRCATEKTFKRQPEGLQRTQPWHWDGDGLALFSHPFHPIIQIGYSSCIHIG